MTRQINEAGLNLIKSHEGVSLSTYQDVAGVLTIGYGHTGADVAPGQCITPDDALALLSDDLERFEAAVEALITVPLNDNQFAALVAFAFNVGDGALEGSSLRRLLNGGDYAAVPGELARWNRAGGRIMAGLIARRAAEAVLWNRPDQSEPDTVST